MKKLGKPATIALAFLVLGFVAIGLSWNGAANKDSIQEQFPYVISGAIAGLGFIGLGIGLMLFEAGRRMSANLDQRFDALTESLQGTASKAPIAASDTPAKGSKAASPNGRVVVGRSSFHRPDCRLVSNADEANFATAEDAIAKGLQPCRVCDPTAVTQARK